MHKQSTCKVYHLPILLIISFLCSSNLVLAQKGALSPNEFLPHKIGEQFTAHHQLVDYFEHLAKHSASTMLIEEYGVSNEERPLMVAYFSSKENIKNLESIRQKHLASAGIGDAKKPSKPIAIVWLSMSVHGNEPSGSECSMELAYRLAEQADASIAEWLKNTVVILDPSLNPDGYSRYSHWYRGISSSHVIPNGDAREHSEPWPGGRVNHYLFDLNRDWAWATQVETQQRLAVYQKWLPHVHADLHEQYINNPYYFAPAAEPMHHYITPFQRKFQETIGQNHAGYFDENGWLYFTREIFDLFYPSYGDTYPMFNGAIGMTYEQAGHSTAGRAIEIANGDTLRLTDRVLHHLTTSLSTIETASREAKEMDAAFSAYFSNAKANPPGKYMSYVLKKENNPAALGALLEMLDRHSIEYKTNTTFSEQLSGFDYKQGKKSTFRLEKGDIVINAHQTQAVLVQVLFEPESKLSDTLTYDITAWSLPFAYGLDAYATPQNIKGDATYKATATKNTVPNNSTLPYAWCIEREGMASAQFIAKMKQKGYQLRYAKNRFSVQNQNFKAGTIVLTKADNKAAAATIQSDMRAITEETGVRLSVIQNSWAVSGPNFGSDAFELMDDGLIAVAYGDKVDAYSYGFVWHYMESDLDMPFIALSTSKISNIKASEYSTLILPEGRYGFSQNTLDNIETFVREGGKLIAYGEAVKSFTGDEGSFGIMKKDDAEKPTNKELIPYSSKERDAISNSLPGAIIRLDLDETHPLNVGMGSYYYTLKTSPFTLDIPEKGAVTAKIASDYTSFGFIGAKTKVILKNSANIIVRTMGSGEAIFFTDDPLFRGFWYQGKVLFANALFL